MKCGKWAHAEHNFREFLTCVMDGIETVNGDSRGVGHDSDEVVDRTLARLERALLGDD